MPHSRGAALDQLVDAGVLVPEPIVYEDFLPRSAAGIFRSNLAGAGSHDSGKTGPPYDLGRLADVLGTPVHDPMDLYAAEAAASLRDAAGTLGVPITPSEEPS